MGRPKWVASETTTKIGQGGLQYPRHHKENCEQIWGGQLVVQSRYPFDSIWCVLPGGKWGRQKEPHHTMKWCQIALDPAEWFETMTLLELPSMELTLYSKIDGPRLRSAAHLTTIMWSQSCDYSIAKQIGLSLLTDPWNWRLNTQQIAIHSHNHHMTGTDRQHVLDTSQSKKNSEVDWCSVLLFVLE